MKITQPQCAPYRDRYVFFLFAMLIAIAVLVISYISTKNYYAPELVFTGLLSSSEHTSAYPPGIFLIVSCFQKITGLAVNHYVYKVIMLMLWFWAAFATARYVLGKGWLCFFAVCAMMLNPYFIWSCLMSSAAASECFFMFLSFYMLIRLHDSVSDSGSHRAFFCFLAGLLAASALVRSTNFVILFSLLGVFVCAGRRKAKKYFAGLLLIFCIYTALFCLYNYKRSLSFGLGTTFGINFFIGNNRDYLHGHPNYDIDIFFEKKILAGIKSGIKGFSEAQQNEYFFKAGINEIRQDVPAFLYRCIVKSLWHWLNVEKIPRFAAPETYIEGDGKTVHVGGIVILPALLYVVYKLLYIPLFVGALLLLFGRKLSLKEAVFFVPYFALWPVVVLLFPDTRFKICAEIMAVIPMMRCLQYGLRKYHG